MCRGFLLPFCPAKHKAPSPGGAAVQAGGCFCARRVLQLVFVDLDIAGRVFILNKQQGGGQGGGEQIYLVGIEHRPVGPGQQTGLEGSAAGAHRRLQLHTAQQHVLRGAYRQLQQAQQVPFRLPLQCQVR